MSTSLIRASIVAGALAIGAAPTFAIQPPETVSEKTKRIAAPSGHQVATVGRNGRVETGGREDVDDLPVIVRAEGAPLILSAGRSLAVRDQRLAALDTLADAVIAVDNDTRKAHGLAARTRAELITRRYTHVFNGFAARIDRRSFEKVRTLPGVTGVWVDRPKAAADADSVPLIRADQVWSQLGDLGDGVTVAVIDTGIDYTRPDLGGCFGPGCKVEMGWDFVNHDADPMDDYGHGTHVAGIVAADGTLKGVAPHARLWAFKVLDRNGNGSDSTIIAGIERATDPDSNPATADGAKVINMSLDGPGDPDDPLSQAADNAMAGGTMVVVAAGNAGPDFGTIGSPGCARQVLTVGASSKTDQMASFSSRGPAPTTSQIKPEIIAPGVGIVSTVPTGSCALCDPSGYLALDGTSMATPHAAGVAALVIHAFPSWTPAQVKAAIMQRTVDLNYGAFVQGSGRLDALNAVTAGARVDVPTYSPGADDLTQATWTRAQVITLTNLSGASLQYTLSVTGSLPAGVSATVAPASVTVPASGSGTFTFTLTVNNVTVPNVPSDPFAYEGKILATRAGETLHIPFAFIKAPALTLAFDQYPESVVVDDDLQYLRLFNFPALSVTMRIPSGRPLDVVTGYPDGVTYVIREGVQTTTDLTLNIAKSEAIYPFTLMPVDKDGAPLTLTYSTTMSHIGPTSGFYDTYTWNDFGGSQGSPTTYYLSSLSSRFIFELAALQEPGGAQPTYFYYGAALDGVHAPKSVQNAPGDFKHVSWGYNVDPGSTTMVFPRTYMNSRPFNAPLIFGYSSGPIAAGVPPPFKIDAYLTPLSSAHAGIAYLSQNVYGDHGLLFQTPYVGALSNTAIDIWDPFIATPVVATSHPSLTSGIGPYRWTGSFSNTPGSINATGTSAWFVSQLHDVRPFASIPYDLLQGGQVVQSGSLGASNVSPSAQIPVTPGAYGLDVQFTSWFLGGQPARAQALLGFDTTATAPNPPALDALTIDGGSDFVDLVPPTGATVKFHATDVAAATPRFYYKTATGFVSAPVTGSANVGYTAVVPPPGGPAPTGPVGVMLRDTYGNTLLYSACSAATASAEVCDGFDDDCDGVIPAGENDADFDGYPACADCNDADDTIWSTPGEVAGLAFASKTSLGWTVPSGSKPVLMRYNLLRSGSPQQFVTGTTCVTTSGSSTVATDSIAPFPGTAFFYQVRGIDNCPSGQGSLGFTSTGAARSGRSCP